jgi:hypothetical protein
LEHHNTGGKDHSWSFLRKNKIPIFTLRVCVRGPALLIQRLRWYLFHINIHGHGHVGKCVPLSLTPLFAYAYHWCCYYNGRFRVSSTRNQSTRTTKKWEKKERQSEPVFHGLEKSA